MKRWIWIAILLLIGAAAIAMVGNLRQLADRLSGFAWPAFVAALGLALGNYTLRFVRWAAACCFIPQSRSFTSAGNRVRPRRL